MRISLAFVPRRPSLCSLLQFVPLILAQPPPVSAAGEFDQTEGGEDRQASPINSRTYAICALHARSNFFARRLRACVCACIPVRILFVIPRSYRNLLFQLSSPPSLTVLYSSYNVFISCVSLTLTIPQFLHCRLASSCEHWMTASHSTSLLFSLSPKTTAKRYLGHGSLSPGCRQGPTAIPSPQTPPTFLFCLPKFSP